MVQEIKYPNQGQEFGGLHRNLNGQSFFGVTAGGADSNPINFPNTVQDPSDGFTQVVIETAPNVNIDFEATTWRFNRPGNSDFKATITLEIDAGTNGYDSYCDVALYSYPDLDRIDIDPNVFIPDGESVEQISEFEFNLEFGQRVYIAVEAIHFDGVTGLDHPGVTILPGAKFNVEATGNQVYPGDDVPTGLLLNPNVTFMQFFQAVVHVVSGLVYYDPNQRTVALYPREETEAYTDILEGYYLPTEQSVNLTDYVVSGSENIVVDTRQGARYLRIKFADSSDGYIESRELDGDNLYSRRVDLGRGDKNEEEEDKNPLFEPTATTGFYRRTIPAIWDDKEPKKPAIDIEPRILYAVGYVYQTLTDGPTNDISAWVFERRELTSIPYIAQLPRAEYLDGGTRVTPTESVVYSSGDDERDLYDMFWKFYIWKYDFAKTFKYIVRLPMRLYKKLNFRHRVYLNYRGKNVAGILKSKDGYESGGDQNVEITIEPDVK